MRYIQLLLSGLLVLSFGCSKFNGQLGKAIENAQSGNFRDALAIYSVLLDKNGEIPLVLNNYGWTLFKTDSLEKAKTVLMKAETLAQSGQLKKLIQTNLSMVRPFLIGKRLLEHGSAADAMPYFHQVTDSFQVHEIGFQYLALCHEALGNEEEAKANWEKIVEIYDNSKVRNHYYLLARKKLRQLGSQAIENGNYVEAIRIFEIIKNAEKDSACSLNYLGWALFRNDELNDAQEVLENAKILAVSKVVQDTIETNLFMVTTFLAGEYSLRKKNYESAIKEFEKVTLRYPESDIGLKYLALCYEGLGDKKTADELWQRVAILNEGHEYKNKYYQIAMQKLKLEPE